ncbi:beta strand repeat-containing protein [Luteolibacter sp. Populi]|uniref:beta strand repeat-containing protein n=1 Tax=Luteolibacter sp. Populi TaxID=3230487 RepID=UPI00346578DE
MNNTPSSASVRAALLTCATLCATIPAHAAKTWTGATDANWATLTNWQEGALPDATENIVFNASSTSNLAINLGANRTVQGISLSNPAGPVTLQNNVLTIGTNGIDVSAATQDLNLASPTNIIRTGNFFWNVPTGRTLTFAAVPHRNSPASGLGGGNNNNVGAVVRVSTTGTVKLTTPNLVVVADGPTASNGGNNPFMTYGVDDWAATDAGGNVIAATYTNDAFTGNANIVTANTYAINGAAPSSVRFANTAGPVIVNNTNTSTLRGILMTSGSQAVTMNGGFVRPNRNNTGGATFSIIQNSTAADLTIASSISNASSGTPVSITKSGAGKLVLTASHGYTGRTFIHEGTLQVGDGITTGNLTSTAAVINNTSLVYNNPAATTLAAVIAGTGTLAKSGDGVLTLGIANTYTGTTTVTGGLLNIGAAASLGATPSLTLDGGGIQWAAAADISAIPITFGTNGVTFDTLANPVVLASPFGNSGTASLTKAGTGTLTLEADNPYSGGTIINAGTLIATNPSGSATGSGDVSVLSGGGIGGTGTITGAVIVEDGAKLTPGTAGVGTLTVGGLDLASGSTLDIEFGGGNDKVTVSSPGGLAVGGGALTLLQAGTANAFATPGTYQLFGYSGALGGSANSLSVANPQPGFTYTFGTAGGFVTLTIGTSGAVRNWTVDGGGSWANNANWNGSFPNASGATANFQINLTAPATVTLDGAKTVGAITFVSANNGYTIAPGSGGSLTLNNGASNSSLLDGAGSHTISAPLILGSNTVVDTAALADSMTLGGLVSGGGKLTKTGPGSLFLLNSNSFTGALTLSGGSTTFASGGLGSGALSIASSKLVWAPGNTQDISNRAITLDTGTVDFDTNGNDVTLANSIGESGSADFQKSGEGRLTLVSDESFLGLSTVAGGTLQLGDGGTTGSVFGDIVNNGALVINHAGPFLFTSGISGTGSLVHQGTGVLELAGMGTFTGGTSISSPAASLDLTNPLALQNSTLSYPDTGGSLSFGANSAATLGGLAGNKNLDLTNSIPGPVALTLGGNNEPTVYTGILSGSGSLNKIGTGLLQLSAAHTYTGSTSVNGGTLELTSGSINTTSANVGVGGQLLLNGGSVTSSAFSTFQNGGVAIRLFSGSLTYAGGVQSSQNDGSLLEVNGGTFSALDVIIRRSLNYNTGADPVPAAAGNGGLVVNGGTATIGNTLQVGTGNSGAGSLVINGSLTVGGVVSIGNATTTRWSLFEVRGGSFVSTDGAQGIVLSPHVTSANRSQFLVSGGTATVERISFGTPTSAVDATGRVTVSSGTLYVGAGGMVQDAPSYTSQVQLHGGTLAAKAAWSSSLPVTTANVFGIRAADSLDAARDITLSGAISGTGSLHKTGSGTLTLSGTYAYTGGTDLDAGTLILSTASLSDTGTLDIASGAVLNLPHGQTDTVAALIIDGVTKPAGTYTSANSSGRITGSGSIVVPVSDPFAGWIAGFPSLTGDAALKTADPDGDGLTNLEEFAFDGHPANGSSDGRVRSRIEGLALVVTLPVRNGATFDNLPGPAADATVDKVIYTIRASNDLASFDQGVTEIPVSSANMPTLTTGWTYRTFRLNGDIGGATPRGPKGFLDLQITAAP